MRLLLLPALALAMLAGSASAETIGEFLKAPVPKDDPVVAKVDQVELKRSDVVRTLQGLPPQVQQMQIEMIYPLLLDRMVDSKLIAKAARAAKVNEDADVKKKVADFEEQTIQQAYLEKQIASRISDDELKKKYQEYVKDNPPQEEVRARHILVADEKTAQAVIADLAKGKDFAALAKEKSTDGTAKEGGDLGFFTEGDMVPEFSKAAFALKQGEYTKTPVKTQFGFHVIKLEERRKSAPPAFDDMKEQLTSDMSQEMIGKVIEGLRKDAKVERFDLQGKPLPPAEPAKP